MAYKIKKRGRPRAIYKVRTIKSAPVCPSGYRPYSVDWKRKKLVFKKVGRPRKK